MKDMTRFPESTTNRIIPLLVVITLFLWGLSFRETSHMASRPNYSIMADGGFVDEWVSPESNETDSLDQPKTHPFLEYLDNHWMSLLLPVCCGSFLISVAIFKWLGTKPEEPIVAEPEPKEVKEFVLDSEGIELSASLCHAETIEDEEAVDDEPESD